jgi:chlorobactene glucosyltransferase
LVLFLSLLAVVLLFAYLISLLMLMESYRDIPKLDGQPDIPLPKDLPLVSVILPVRNEEKNIPVCLGALVRQDYPRLEVIIIDDHSTDRTSEIVRSFQQTHDQIKLISGKPLPDGWAGKVYALSQGAAVARGDYLIFVDADTELAPDGVRKTMACALQRSADLLTIIPKLECRSFWEKVIQPIMAQLILVWFPAKAINDPNSPVAAANGPFLLFKRESYEKIGGHAALKGIVVEDMALAAKIKEHKMRISYVLAKDAMRLRMYSGFKQLWNGWSRNFYVGLNRNAGLAVAAVFGISLFFILPWLMIPISLGWLLAKGWSLSVFTMMLLWTGVCLAALTARWALHTFYDIDTSHALLQPLGALVTIGMVLNSTWKGIMGKNVPWRDRGYRPST